LLAILVQGKLVMNSELKKLYEMIEESKVAMMTTRRRDGRLRSRPMANQKQAGGADLWFVTFEGAGKLEDIEHDPHVNLSYFRESKMEWVSISGIARVSRDRQIIRELYASDWKIWFPEEGDPRHGTSDDPRMVLMGVEVEMAEFLEVNKPKPVVFFEIAKGWLTGSEPDVGEMHKLEQPHRG
jgi:general stress protein 26